MASPRSSHPIDRHPDTKGEGFDEATPNAQRHSASPAGVDATQRRRGIRHVRRELQRLVLRHEMTGGKAGKTML